MTNKLTLTEQKELFAKDCKLINLKYEYNGYTGDEKWAIITELSVKELWEKYPLVIERYSPFVHLSIAQGEVIDDANRNEDKYAKRSSRTLDCYGYDDEMSSQFHKELAIMFDDPFERAEEERLELEREELRQCEIRKARIALSMLQPLQRERLMKNVCCGLSSRAIAKQEGVYYSSVDKSIAAAKKNFIKLYLFSHSSSYFMLIFLHRWGITEEAEREVRLVHSWNICLPEKAVISRMSGLLLQRSLPYEWGITYGLLWEMVDYMRRQRVWRMHYWQCSYAGPSGSRLFRASCMPVLSWRA